MKKAGGLVMTAILALSFFPSMAQQLKPVTGVVRDSATGQPLPGVTVVEVGTSRGSTTDANGKFSFTPAKATGMLKFSYLGYNDKVIPEIKAGLLQNVRLSTNNKTLNEVVVVGYGSQERKDVTGAITGMTAAKIKERPITRIGQAMQGQMAGVQVRSTTGEPGAALQIRVRGNSSISAGNDPLYVVDGVPVPDLSNLNPGDIASIQVLKDAASTAIYGSRGANGVVLITTKKGMAGKTRFQFNAYYGVQTLAKKMDLLSAPEWIDMYEQAQDSAYIKKGLQTGQVWSASDPISVREKNLGLAPGTRSGTYIPDPRWADGTDSLDYIDWQDAFYNPATITNYQLAASGGTDKMTYRVSGNYLYQDGIAAYTNYKLFSIRASMQIQLTSFLKMGIDLSPSYSWLDGGNVDGKDAQSHHVLAIAPVAEKDAGINSGVAPYGRYYWAGSTQSPIAYQRETTNELDQQRLLSSMYLQADIYKGIGLKVSGAWNTDQQNHKTYHPTLGVGQVPGSGSSASYTTANTQYYLLEAFLTYNRSFGGHNIDAIAGYTVEDTRRANTNQSNKQFANDDLTTLNMNTSTPTASNTDELHRTLLSYLARVQYNYKNKYLATASIRRDGSSIFGSDNKWGYFPAFSLGWNLAQENFMKDVAWVSELKLRYSFGENGNNDIPDYSAYGSIDPYNYSFGGTLVNGYAPSSLSNPDLQWEKTRSSNYGLDLGLWNNRVSLSADYYNKYTTDLLLDVPVALSTGFASGYVNIGHVQNRGVEFQVNTQNLTGRLTWQTSLNFSINHNKVLQLGNGNAPIHTGFSNQTQLVTVGQPIGVFYLYDAIGVYKDNADLKGSPHMSKNIQGDVKYKDVSGPGGKPDGVIDDNDRTIMGQPDPTYNWGIYNSFSYHNFDLSFLIQGSGGNKVYDLIGRAIDRPGMGTLGNALGRWRDRWRSPDQPGDGHTPRIDGTTGGLYDSRWLYDGTYARFKSLIIGYTFPAGMIRGVDNLRLYFSGENLFYIYNPDYGGYSPEALNTTGSAAGAGDYGAYPDARTIMVGVNLSF
jgi:TonB-linked SusC/RagA family outer membrane protein